ncbi:MAG TPA: M1 family metallopeptidase [Chitinophagaceae bacterium]|nr:M1 family metallopeptidase [Chitinophagaceae bacterium]
MNKIIALIFLFIFSIELSYAQPDRWQQRIKYQIAVNVNVVTNRFTGTEKIDYWNNSPDTLDRVFFHTYWNAFQPNSMMDVRSRELGKIVDGYTKNNTPVYDWDGRVKDRIQHLSPTQIGYDTVDNIQINGINQQLIWHETILEVRLGKPIPPHSKTSMDVTFKCQVPLQIRRSGRDNAEGIRYSMSQWYPKMVEYDYQGWNANPYIAREFYGVWGDYDVSITIDKTYMVAASGTIQNANEVGFGYQPDGVKVKPPAGNTLTWRFSGQTIHDFVWAADPTYIMIKKQVVNGPLLYVVYKNVDSLQTRWHQFADTMAAAYPFMAKTFGPYPYKNYSFIQGGDGGMEYPMATLIKSAGYGTGIHEWMHSWYQGMMGSNESLYPWMDEGFASYAEARTSAWLRHDTSFAYNAAYKSYFNLVKSEKEEPLSTHSDHYNTNYAYNAAAYGKGAVFLAQLGYIVGDNTLDKILLEYYKEWRFKHPNPNDFIRVAEKVSGIELQWYKEYWIYTTKTIDYAVGDVNVVDGKTVITLKRIGYMPMPVDVLITYKDGTKEMHYIPMNLMYGQKPAENEVRRIVHDEWKWTNPEYGLKIGRSIADIKQIEIDPSDRMADINRGNNKLTVPE